MTGSRVQFVVHAFSDKLRTFFANKVAIANSIFFTFCCIVLESLSWFWLWKFTKMQKTHVATQLHAKLPPSKKIYSSRSDLILLILGMRMESRKRFNLANHRSLMLTADVCIYTNWLLIVLHFSNRKIFFKIFFISITT